MNFFPGLQTVIIATGDRFLRFLSHLIALSSQTRFSSYILNKTTHLHTILIITHILRAEQSEQNAPVTGERRAVKRPARLGSLNHAHRSARSAHYQP